MAVRVAYGRPAGGAADRTKPASSTERSAAPDSFSAADFLRGRFSQLVFFGAGFLGAKFLGDRFLRRELSRSVSFVPTPCSATAVVGAVVLGADMLGADVSGAGRRSSRRRRGGGPAPSSVDFHSCLPSSRAPVGG
jgi:hypothetical protein